MMQMLQNANPENAILQKKQPKNAEAKFLANNTYDKGRLR